MWKEDSQFQKQYVSNKKPETDKKLFYCKKI